MTTASTEGALRCALCVCAAIFAGCPPPTGTGGAVDLVYISTSNGESTVVAYDLEEATGRVLGSVGTTAQSTAFLDADTLITSRDGGLHRTLIAEDTSAEIDIAGLVGAGPVVALLDGRADLLFAGSEPVADDVEANQDIYRLDLQGGAPARLTDDVAADGPGGVMSDGSIVFVSNRSGRFDLWRMDASGENEAPLVVESGVFGRPAVSRDGSILCWERVDGLVVADSVGGEPTPLGGGVAGSDPAFDAAGRVFFRRFLPDFTAEIFVFDPADGSTTQVTSDGAIASAPSLAP